MLFLTWGVESKSEWMISKECEKGQGVEGEGQTLREGNIKPVFFLAGDAFIFGKNS